MITKIESIEDDDVAIYKLLRDAIFREDGSFIADSPKVVNLLLEKGVEVKSILATQEYYDTYHTFLQGKNIPQKYLTTKEQMQKIVGHTLHHNCMMHGVRPSNVTIDTLSDGVLLLDGITSSQNVGAIVRSCAALGVDSLALSKATPHPFNRRALRVSMGYASLVKTYIYEDIKQTIQEFQKRGYKVYAAELNGDAVALGEFTVADSWVLILGHEGKGVAEEILQLCDAVVFIEMQAGVKSLNVGVAASILMYSFTNKR